jgi:hypothetical protein
MNIRTLSLSSLLLVASFTQCNEVQKVENSPQEDAFAAYLELTELQTQFINSEEMKNLGIAMREHQIALNNLMLARILNNPQTSPEFINAFYTSNKAACNARKKAQDLNESELSKKIAELQQKHQ